MSEMSSGRTARRGRRRRQGVRPFAARDELGPGAVRLLDGTRTMWRSAGSASGRARRCDPRRGIHPRRSAAGPRARQDVSRLGGGVAGVQRHQHRTRMVGGQAGDHPVPGVRATRPATRSPGLTPRSTMAAAARRTSSRSWVNVSVFSGAPALRGRGAHGRSDPAPQVSSAGRSSSKLLVLSTGSWRCPVPVPLAARPPTSWCTLSRPGLTAALGG